jgi:hypothetical protein
MFATLMIASLLWSAPAVAEDTTDPTDMLAPNDPNQRDRELPAPKKKTSEGQSPQKGVPASQVEKPRTAKPATAMPGAPTDKDAETGQPYQWLPPTANGPGRDDNNSDMGTGGLGMGGGRGAGFYGPSRLPRSPTHARPGQAMSNNAMQDAQLNRMKIEASSQTMTGVQPATQKPYAGMPMNTGGVSPYLNLYRSGTNNGTIDNYSTLVRPELDQRRMNQQFGNDIRGLENRAQVQGFRLYQLNRDSQNLQGIKYQHFFMNYGDFYPNARQ